MTIAGIKLQKQRVRFLDRAEVTSFFTDKTVAVVGSGPGVLDNEEGFIDGHDVVLRVNNYQTFAATGYRCDVYYSFFGNSIRKSAEDLQADGVKLCICKCPDAHVINSDWHQRRGKMQGVDFRWIYQMRRNFWFCDTYIPSVEEFMATFNLLGQHVATTGFAAILEVLSFTPKAVYLTGFDFFRSGIHNVDKVWRKGDPRDPIGHKPELERLWLRDNYKKHPITMDAVMMNLMGRIT